MTKGVHFTYFTYTKKTESQKGFIRFTKTMPQIEDEYIFSKPKLVFSHIRHKFFFRASGTIKTGGNSEKWGKIQVTKKCSEI